MLNRKIPPMQAGGGAVMNNKINGEVKLAPFLVRSRLRVNCAKVFSPLNFECVIFLRSTTSASMLHCFIRRKARPTFKHLFQCRFICCYSTGHCAGEMTQFTFSLLSAFARLLTRTDNGTETTLEIITNVS